MTSRSRDNHAIRHFGVQRARGRGGCGDFSRKLRGCDATPSSRVHQLYTNMAAALARAHLDHVMKKLYTHARENNII